MSGETFDGGDSISDDWRQVEQRVYDPEGDADLATVVVEAIAAARGVDPLDYESMPPLYEFADAESIEETLFGPTGTETERTGREGRDEESVFTFRYGELGVAVNSEGWVSVYEPQ
ncbi:HalOD1 output domain-containing protein [Halorussus salinus]|uniref:HalOD1 output domain-containing protein n=1 Tax=Halorussus salinus TaxID=1364935 RepID=UPI0010926A93|nr:HalOD1 output domain-containing protein [Halorussus salinus]